MRLWTISLEYLDAKGLVALWRESLLAKNVLRGNTRGYLNHPQLDRFKESEQPLVCIEKYLSEIYKESVRRGYKFNKTKVSWDLVDCYSESYKIEVSQGQIDYEFQHILNKVMIRDITKYKELLKVKDIKVVSGFIIVPGNNIEKWEKVA